LTHKYYKKNTKPKHKTHKSNQIKEADSNQMVPPLTFLYSYLVMDCILRFCAKMYEAPPTAAIARRNRRTAPTFPSGVVRCLHDLNSSNSKSEPSRIQRIACILPVSWQYALDMWVESQSSHGPISLQPILAACTIEHSRSKLDKSNIVFI